PAACETAGDRSRSALTTAFLQGLREEGYIEHQNVLIEFAQPAVHPTSSLLWPMNSFVRVPMSSSGEALRLRGSCEPLRAKSAPQSQQFARLPPTRLRKASCRASIAPAAT